MENTEQEIREVDSLEIIAKFPKKMIQGKLMLC